MPSKSRKKIKGQARKAKAKEAAADAAATAENNAQRSTVSPDGIIRFPNNSICNHGDLDKKPIVCRQFIDTFFKSFISTNRNLRQTKSAMMGAVNDALSEAYNKFPEAVNDESNRQIVKKNIICNGTTYLLVGENLDSSPMSLACVVTLMYIDTYDPSNPIPLGNFDNRHAKNYLRHVDIVNGCQRSLVKYFMNQIPCYCLNELYTQVRCTTPKMGKCWGCNQMKERSTLYICTGCERVQYCSKACQIEDVPDHKEYCKMMQSYDRAHNPR